MEGVTGLSIKPTTQAVHVGSQTSRERGAEAPQASSSSTVIMNE